MSWQLHGKVAIVTGANQGLGLEITHRYVQAGASVIMCARNKELLESAQEQVSKAIASKQVVLAMPVDVAKSESVSELVQTVQEKFGKIDILVNNAGIYGPMGPIEDVNWSQWVQTIEINLLGSVLMAKNVVPVMKKQSNGKIIQISGGGATNPMPNISAYAVSKAAVVRFAETLAEELREFHIDVNAIAPGALNTRMLEQVLAAGPEKVGHEFFNRAVKQKESGGTQFDHGTDLALFLASSASNGITAKLISAVWDNWQQWPEHLEELNHSDVYTLRRITGRERNFSWGDK